MKSHFERLYVYPMNINWLHAKQFRRALEMSEFFTDKK